MEIREKKNEEEIKEYREDTKEQEHS